MDSFAKAQKAAKKFIDQIDKKNVLSIVRVGSSLRKEDFHYGSDIDIVVIQKLPPKHFMSHHHMDGFEIGVITRGKKELLSLLKQGVPLDLVAVKYGAIAYDTGFFSKVQRKVHPPTNYTIEQWLKNSSFHLGEAAHTYSLPIGMHGFFKSLHHAAREGCRAIIAKEKKEIVEGDQSILNTLKSSHPSLYKNFKLLVDAKKKWETFSSESITSSSIKVSGRGKYFLAAEDVVCEGINLCKNTNVPRINDLIITLKKKYPITELHHFQIHPESKQLMVFLLLKGDKLGCFMHNCDTGKTKKLSA